MSGFHPACRTNAGTLKKASCIARAGFHNHLSSRTGTHQKMHTRRVLRQNPRSLHYTTPTRTVAVSFEKGDQESAVTQNSGQYLLPDRRNGSTKKMGQDKMCRCGHPGLHESRGRLSGFCRTKQCFRQCWSSALRPSMETWLPSVQRCRRSHVRVILVQPVGPWCTRLARERERDKDKERERGR